VPVSGSARAELSLAARLLWCHERRRADHRAGARQRRDPIAL
jgi:hypothetical protein